MNDSVKIAMPSKNVFRLLSTDLDGLKSVFQPFIPFCYVLVLCCVCNIIIGIARLVQGLVIGNVDVIIFVNTFFF